MPAPLHPDDFNGCFEALTGNRPYPWQRRLHARLLGGDPPTSCDLPTGLGKTSIVALWLLARAQRPDALARRLVYCVNRRTIVDQVSDLLVGMREALTKPGLSRVRDALGPVALSTLRGQLADNRAWMDPQKTAVVVATPDLAGSGLLFRAYRRGWRSWPYAAGLLGHDTLFVHDEAHLSIPFQRLLERVHTLQERQTPGGRGNLRVVSLSATAAGGGGGPSFTLDAEDLGVAEVRRRLSAAKRLRLHPAETTASASKQIADCALRYADQPVKVLVYVRSPKAAAGVHAAIEKGIGRKNGAAERTKLLTGTLRGKERDLLAGSVVLRRLVKPEDPSLPPLERAEYLVSTSAGAVGADFDADHLVCDAVPADELVQRLGRVNRRGSRSPSEASRVDVFHTPLKTKSGFDAAASATTEMLASLGARGDEAIDASPGTVGSWVTEENRAPAAEPVYLSEAQLDALTMTSVRGDWNAVPLIPPLIHGLEEDAPQTTLLWRVEAGLFDAPAAAADLEALVRSHRPFAHERVQVPAFEAAAFIAERVKQLPPEDADSGEARSAFEQIPHQAIVVSATGDAHVRDLRGDPPDAAELAGATLILAAAFGGLSDRGVLTPGAAPPGTSLDVADDDTYGAGRGRVLLASTPAGGWSACTAPRIEPEGFESLAAAREWARSGGTHRIAREIVLRVNPEDGTPALRLLLLTPNLASSAGSGPAVTLATHTADVKRHAERIARAVAPEWESLLGLAGRWHDRGKDRPLWQAACGNLDAGSEPLAKSKEKGFRGRLLGGYRHELGSARDFLLDGSGGESLRRPCLERDLFLHVLTAHHGRARPTFAESELGDPLHGDPLPAELTPEAVARRFERLQRRFGPWRLAWLESILRAADALASEEEQGATDD